MNAIETENLTKRFVPVRTFGDLFARRWRRQPRTAVDEVTIQIGEGELFGLLGENGAGKTTLIRMLSTTLLPTSGRASVLGFDVVADAPAVRRRVGIVSGDERSFYWRLSGRQNLEYFAALYHLPRPAIARRIDEVLVVLDIAAIADRRFDSYSTGIKQRFAIARGMLVDPRVLFLDEPTRALDPIAASELRHHLVHSIGRMGYTALLATHTLSEAEEICDRVAIMRAGHVVHTGTMDELRSDMGLTTVLELAVSRLATPTRERLAALDGVENVVVDVGDDGRVRLDIGLGLPSGPITDIMRTVVDGGAEIYSSSVREPTLDDVYRRAHD